MGAFLFKDLPDSPFGLDRGQVYKRVWLKITNLG
jgi:hypothetical protein